MENPPPAMPLVLTSEKPNVRYNEDGTRQGKILTLLGLTGFDGTEGVRDRSIYTTVGAFLAWKELETRSGAVLPHLPALLEGCDMHWDYEARDTRFAPLEAIRQLLESTGLETEQELETVDNSPVQQQQYEDQEGTIVMDHELPEQEQPPREEHLFFAQGIATRPTTQEQSKSSRDFLPPFAMIGAYSSRVSSTLGILGNAFAIPQISGSSTSAQLDDVPLFARTIPTDDAMAEAFIYYMHSLNVTHIANIYIRDSYGTPFHQSLQRYADDMGIHLQGIPYVQGNELQVTDQLKDSKLRFVFATIVEWQDLIQVAYEQEVIGEGYAWYMSEKLVLTRDTFELRSKNEKQVARALSGIGLVNVLGVQRNELYLAFQEFVVNGTSVLVEAIDDGIGGLNRTLLQEEYITKHVHPEIFDGYIFPPYAPSSNQNFYFDATIAIGLASCQAPGLFTSRELYEQLLKVDFEGVTGRVSFNDKGNRKLGGVKYRVDNLRVSEERSDSKYYRFDSSLAAIISDSNVTQVDPFLFPTGDNQLTSVIPASLPPLDHDYNFLDSWARTTGFVLGSFVMLLSVVIMCWTWWKRTIFVIKAAQPPFLMQLCCGTLIMASAVFPMSLQAGGEDEMTNQFKYNTACTSVFWLLSLGFVTSFSAIFAKTWRLNKLLNAGKAIRRVQVNAKDVILPFCILMTINISMLLGLTFVAPYEFQRINLNDQDTFGRSEASYGTCRASSNLVFVFLIPMLLTNAVALLLAGWQCYVARNLSVEFSETHYLAMSTAIMSETVFLSAPVLIALFARPTAFYVFASIAVTLIALSILVPVFLPKWFHRHQKQKTREAQMNLAPRQGATDAMWNVGTSHDAEDVDSESEAQSSKSRASYGRMKIHRKEKTVH